MAAQREGGGRGGDLLVLVALGVGGREERRVGGTTYGRRLEVLAQQPRLGRRLPRLTALQRIPRSPSTVRVTGVVATTSRERPASSGSSRTTEWTSVVAPPMSTTTTSSPDSAASTSTPVSTRSGVAPLHHRGEVGPRAEPLPADHVLEEHLADRPPRRARAPARRSAGPRCRPARTASRPGQRRGHRFLRLDVTGDHDRSRQPTSARNAASATSPSESPPSVPPTSSSTSGRASTRAACAASSSPPDRTATTLPPLDSATRRPASAVTSASLPTTAIRSPPPADEQASTSAFAAAGSAARARPGTRRSVEHVGVQRGGRWPAVAEQRPGPAVDQRGLGEGRPDVDAHHRSGHRSAGLRDDVDQRRAAG